MVPILVALSLGAACKADLPDQIANDASGDFPCSTYADLLVAYNPAGTEGGSEAGLDTLGEPDGTTVELTPDGVLTVSFVGLGSVIDQTGDDIRVHATLDAGAEVAVYAAGADAEFVYTGGLASGQTDVDLAVGTVRTATSVQLVGIAGSATVDAFEALQTPCSN